MEEMKKTLIKMLHVFGILGLVMACQTQETKQNKGESLKDSTTVSMDSLELVIDTIVIKTMPKEPDYDTTEWADIALLDTSIVIDMKYATTENFVGEKMYECGRCFVRPEVAQSILKIQQKLRAHGLGLKMYDCFRPRPVQYALWEKVPDPRYVSDPKKGSMHNRGAAIDITLVTLDGQELEMGTAFDYFGKEAYHAYQELPEAVLKNRKFLKETMEKNGFRSIRTEWWHYSYTLKSYALSDMLWKCY